MMPTYARKNTRLIVLILVSIITLSFLAYLIINRPTKQVTIDSDGELPGRASLINKDRLYATINNLDQYVSVQKDIFAFGVGTIDAYRADTNPRVIFTVDTANSSGSTVSFSGHFDKAKKQKISASVTKLKNNRLKITVTNQSNGANIDSQLPSNSARNQYIGRLPDKGPGYEIDYVPYEDKFSLSVGIEYTQANLKDAQSALAKGLGVSRLGDDYYFLVERVGVKLPDEIITQ